MLRALGIALGLTTAVAQAQEAAHEDGLKRLQQLTVGVGDQFLGQLAPDGHAIHFVSNRNTVSEIYKQDIDDARATVMFDEGAEVTWPRVSADGKHLLYISFQAEAAGQLCVRDLPNGDNQRCLDDDASAVQAEWLTNDEVALLDRQTIEGDFRLMRVRVGRGLSATVWLKRNLTGPAISPDGRWLVYLPVERYVERVGPGFAARAAPRLEAVRLNQKSLEGQPLHLELPGLTGQPAFARDSQYLYVAQFFADSNHDGLIDAGDHGVLFRVPFPSARDDAPEVASRSVPEQLTDASWNCQYPAPAKTELIATCARHSGLAVFGMPLTGRVPPSWDAARIRTELELSTRNPDRLLLLRSLLAQQTTLIGRRVVTMQLIRLHLHLDELEPAELYVQQLSAVKDPSSAGIASGLRTLIEQRRALHERAAGRLETDFAAGVRQRLKNLVPKSAWAPVARAFAHVVRSELWDSLGELGEARAELEAVKLDEVTMPSVLQAYYERAESLYRRLDSREALARAAQQLSAHPLFSPDQQLTYALAAVRAETRGLPESEARTQLAADGTDALGFARQLERVMLSLKGDHPSDAALQSMRALYQAQSDPGRKRVVMHELVQRATDLHADSVEELLADLYLNDAPPGTDERRRAERLFQRVMLGRAYRELSEQKVKEAAADFEAVGRHTGSLEAYIGAINASARLGNSSEKILEHLGNVEPAEDLAFIKAYIASRELGHLKGQAHQKIVDAAIRDLRGSWNQLKASPEARALMGALWHEQFVEQQDRAAAQRANVHYLIALDLVRSNLRLKAMVLGQLALLQSQVGNYRIALGFLADREKLPYADNGAGLAVRLARARTLFHVGDSAKAAKTADEALALIGRKERLVEYRVLALDWAALYHLAAGQFEPALKLYEEEQPLLDAAASDRNRLTARLGHAAAALGAGQPEKSLDDLAYVDVHLAGPTLLPGLEWPHVTDVATLRAYRLIAAGLRANAQIALGHLEQAGSALDRRRELLAEQLKAAPDLVDNVRALTLANARLAENARAHGEALKASTYLLQALTHADMALKESGAPVDADSLTVLFLAAELRDDGAVRPPFNLSARLRTAHEALLKERDPLRRGDLHRMEVYRALETKPH